MMIEDLLFYSAFATLITHELDAVTQQEWKLLFVLRNLPEQIVPSAFVVIHVPLIVVLLWLTNSESISIQHWSRLALAMFLIIHAGLHKRLEHHPQYTFQSPLSLGLIYGGGLLGLLYWVSIVLSGQLQIVRSP